MQWRYLNRKIPHGLNDTSWWGITVEYPLSAHFTIMARTMKRKRHELTAQCHNKMKILNEVNEYFVPVSRHYQLQMSWRTIYGLWPSTYIEIKWFSLFHAIPTTQSRLIIADACDDNWFDRWNIVRPNGHLVAMAAEMTNSSSHQSMAYETKMQQNSRCDKT